VLLLLHENCPLMFLIVSRGNTNDDTYRIGLLEVAEKPVSHFSYACVLGAASRISGLTIGAAVGSMPKCTFRQISTLRIW
jgi:hypothetical protein